MNVLRLATRRSAPPDSLRTPFFLACSSASSEHCSRRVKIFLPLLAFLILLPATALAQSTPDTLVYEGLLLNSAGNPQTEPVTFRFSFWKTTDWTSEHTSTGGAINTDSPDFGGWYEFQTVTPNITGRFAAQLGSAMPLPSPDFADQKFLQVEIKNAGEDDTEYQILDPTDDDGEDTEDRKPIGSVLFAKNAERIQNRSIGTGSGEILILGENGTISIAQMSSGTTFASFTINADNQETDTNLIFGSILELQILRYSFANERFEFSDDLYVEGDVTASGTLVGDGVTITSLPNCDTLDTDADGNIICGTDAQGASAQEPIVIRKSADETISNEKTLQDDDELLFAVGADETWVFEFHVIGNAHKKADFRFGLSTPEGSTCAFSVAAGKETSAHTSCSESSRTMSGKSDDRPYSLDGTIITGTGGNVTLQWSQNKSKADPAIIRAGSWLRAWRVE